MDRALSGLTIVEFPGGVATRYCGHLFAAHGATVLQIGVRRATAIGYGGAGSEAYARWLDAGKPHIAELPPLWASGKQIDLVIAGQDHASVAAPMRRCKRPDSKALRLGLTWFAKQGPYRDWAGTDAVIQAISAVAYATGAKDGTPMLPRGHAPQTIAGATAFIASLGALFGKPSGWRGRTIDVNILEANLCLSESGAASVAADRRPYRAAWRQPFHADLSRRHLPGQRRLDRRDGADATAMALAVRDDRPPGARERSGASRLAAADHRCRRAGQDAGAAFKTERRAIGSMKVNACASRWRRHRI